MISILATAILSYALHRLDLEHKTEAQKREFRSEQRKREKDESLKLARELRMEHLKEEMGELIKLKRAARDLYKATKNRAPTEEKAKYLEEFRSLKYLAVETLYFQGRYENFEAEPDNDRFLEFLLKLIDEAMKDLVDREDQREIERQPRMLGATGKESKEQNNLWEETRMYFLSSIWRRVKTVWNGN